MAATVLTLLVVLTASDTAHDFIEQALAFARTVIERYPDTGVVVFVLLAAVSSLAFFFSSAVIVPIAVYAWGRPVTVFLLCVGWLGGGAAA